ncbi:hypothetical protein AAFN60_21160 [Roseibacillus persicicus]|uniref:hypothetical protein n=1 Tax=Roseibacillus persicicus TaxID=454148 RepID=UPI00398B4D5F
MKKVSLIFTISAAAIFLFGGCKQDRNSFSQTKEEILKELEAKEGEIVNVMGRDGVSYVWSGSATSPIGAEDNPESRSGTTHRGLTMRLPEFAGYYHEIEIYDGSDGGGMLVGRKIKAQED